MTVRQFLSRYNIGRSAITSASVVDTGSEYAEYVYSKRELMHDAYGHRFGDLKIDSFTITETCIVIYAH